MKWKAYLNGTTSVTPILDLVNVEYIASYTTSGYLYVYQYIGSSSSNTVAVQVDYNATMPSGTSIRLTMVLAHPLQLWEWEYWSIPVHSIGSIESNSSKHGLLSLFENRVAD